MTERLWGIFTKGVHRLFQVDFLSDSATGDVETIRKEVTDQEDANAVSSELMGFIDDGDWMTTQTPEAKRGYHTIMIDVDVPAKLVPSTTPGHHHLYVGIDPVPWEDYEAWLKASAKIGLIEYGYLHASSNRKASFLRLPWVQKKEGEK